MKINPKALLQKKQIFQKPFSRKDKFQGHFSGEKNSKRPSQGKHKLISNFSSASHTPDHVGPTPYLEIPLRAVSGHVICEGTTVEESTAAVWKSTSIWSELVVHVVNVVFENMFVFTLIATEFTNIYFAWDMCLAMLV